jgi:hypothetical protein
LNEGQQICEEEELQSRRREELGGDGEEKQGLGPTGVWLQRRRCMVAVSVSAPAARPGRVGVACLEAGCHGDRCRRGWHRMARLERRGRRGGGGGTGR